MFTLSVTFLVPSGLTILALPLLVLLLITVLLISEYHGINVVSQPASTANVIQSTPNNNHYYLLLEYAEATWRNSQMHSYGSEGGMPVQRDHKDHLVLQLRQLVQSHHPVIEDD